MQVQTVTHTNVKSALISSGSLVLRLNSTTATLPSDKARDQISKPFSANCNMRIKTLKLVNMFHGQIEFSDWLSHI